MPTMKAALKSILKNAKKCNVLGKIYEDNNVL